MTQENGGINSDDVKNGTGNANEQGGGNDTAKQIDELKAQIQTLQKESSGKDRKIAEFLKEQELSKLNSQTEKEQLESWKLKAEQYERKEAYRQSFKEVGLDPDEFENIIEEKDPKTQAEKFAKLLKAKSEASVNKALEDFKKKELDKKGEVPDPSESKKPKYSDVDAFIRNAVLR